MARQKCQHCGRRVGHDKLMESRDPWDNDKWKWVCIDADSCAQERIIQALLPPEQRNIKL